MKREDDRFGRVLLAAALFFTSTAALGGQGGGSPINLDPGLIVPLAEVPKAITRKVITREPLVARFSRGQYEIFFVAAAHETAPGPTFALIERCFKRFPANAVVREGHAFADGPAPRTRAVEIEREGGPRSEADQAAALGLARGLPVYGGEPTEEEKLATALASGYSRDEFISLEYLSMVGYFMRVGQWKAEKAAQVFSEISTWVPEAPNAPPFDFAGFLRLYREKKGESFDPSDEAEFLSGPNPKGGHWQRLGHAVDMGRNRFLAEVLSKLLLRHKRVLVVYGNGHLAVQWRALVAAFGPPVYLGTLKEQRDNR